MGANEKFCLRWNDFESNISVAFREIREEKDFFDCTLSVGDRQVHAHKLILSACSPFFRSVLRKNPHQHPLLYLKGVEFSDLQSVLNFMYHGEVNVAQEELNSFLAVAEDLQVKGLTQNITFGVTSISNKTTEAAPKLKTKSAPRRQKPKSVVAPPSSTTIPPTVLNDPPPPKRPRPTPQYQQDDDDIQEVMPEVKTEPIVEQQQPTVSTYQTPSYSEIECPGTNGTLTKMEDQTVDGEEDGYDYEVDEEGYEGMEGTVENIENIEAAEDNQNFIKSNVGHSTRQSPKSTCPQCGKPHPNVQSMKAHLRQAHGKWWNL